MVNQNELKKQAARAAMEFVKPDSIVGVGTGSTVNYFIEALAEMRNKIEGAVASSVQTEKLLRGANIPVLQLNSVSNLPLYVDGCDEFNEHFYLVKGGGGALTREKIVASMAEQFVCIADQSKEVSVLGKFPVAVEVIPMARSMIARQLVKLGGDPMYREGFVTDNGNVILDVHNLDLQNPLAVEEKIKLLTGVVENGIFAKRKADIILVASESGIKRLANAL